MHALYARQDDCVARCPGMHGGTDQHAHARSDEKALAGPDAATHGHAHALPHLKGADVRTEHCAHRVAHRLAYWHAHHRAHPPPLQGRHPRL